MNLAQEFDVADFFSKGRRVALVVAAIGWALVSCGCSSAVPHPPTFADFHRLGPGMLEDEKKLNAQLAVFEAAIFTRRDIEVIRAKGNAHELVGAGLQSRGGDENSLELILEALSRGSNDPVVLTGVIRHLVRDGASPVERANGVPDLVQVLTLLERLEPENGLPLCLRAYVELKRGDTNG